MRHQSRPAVNPTSARRRPGLAEADTSTLATKQDLAEFKAELFRHLWIMAAGIVGLTVTLIKVLPG